MCGYPSPRAAPSWTFPGQVLREHCRGCPHPLDCHSDLNYDGSLSLNRGLKMGTWYWGEGLNKLTLRSLLTAIWGFSVAQQDSSPLTPLGSYTLPMPALCWFILTVTCSWYFPHCILSLLKLSKDISSVQPEEETGADGMNSDKHNCMNPLLLSPGYGSTLSVFILFKS